jgi:hypothetical protein
LINSTVNPHSSEVCPDCGGCGLNEATARIKEEWYSFDNYKEVWLNEKHTQRYNDNAHQNHLTQTEVDALLENNRLWDLREKLGRDPTVEEVNDWSIHDLMGHDGINRSICVKARAMELGVYGVCPTCEGEGRIWDSPEARRKAEAWEPQEPPVGPGFQLWETTTEGSPQSPVFATLKELAAWCEKNATVFGGSRASAEEWEKMLSEDKVYLQQGNMIFI